MIKLSFKRNSIYLIINQAVSSVCGFVMSIVLARYLTLDEYGSYGTIVSSVALLGVLVSLGLEGINARYIVEYQAIKEFKLANFLVKLTFLLRVLSAIVVCTSIWVLKDEISELLNLEQIVLDFLLLLLFVFILSRLRTLAASIHQANFELYKDAQNQIFYNLSKLLLFSISLILDFGLSGIFITWLFIELLSFIHHVFVLSKKYTENRNKYDSNIEVEKFETKRIIKFGGYSYFGISLFVFVDTSVDTLVIAHYMETENVALYVFTVGILMVVSRLNPVQLLRGFFDSYIIKRYVDSADMNQLETSYTILLKVALFVMLPLYIVVIIFAEQIVVMIYDEKFLVAVPMIQLFAFFMLFKSIIVAYNPVIYALERSDLFLFAGVFSLYNLIMDIVLVPEYGEYGAIIATGTSYLFLYIYYLIALKIKSKANLGFPIKALIMIFVYLLPSTLIVYSFGESVENIIQLVGLIIICMISYLVLYFKFKLFTANERTEILNLLGKKWAKFV